MTAVQPRQVILQTTDQPTAELLALALGGPPLDASDIDILAGAIDAGRFVRSAATPDHVPIGLDIPAALIGRIAGVLELARRAAVTPPRRVVRRPADVAVLAEREIGGRDRECVLVVVCDAANAVIDMQIVSRGAADRTLFPVREIVATVLRADGRAFAVAHNHPSGRQDASNPDISATGHIAEAARSVGLRFLGHVEVTPHQITQSWPATHR